jgi:hypothetical protein
MAVLVIDPLGKPIQVASTGILFVAELVDAEGKALPLTQAGATVKMFTWKKPGTAAVVTRDQTQGVTIADAVGVEGQAGFVPPQLQWTIPDGETSFLDAAGDWQVQGYVVQGAHYRGELSRFPVAANLQ